MPRSVPMWAGARPETPPPPRVKARIIERQGGKCAHCNRRVGMAGEAIEFDHVVALVNGGENTEANLQALCALCHVAKTREDVAEKSRVARKRAKHLGISAKPRQPVGGWAAIRFKRKVGGGVVRREAEE